METTSGALKESGTSSAHIRLESVTKTFAGGDIVAVEDFSLDIGSDEFVVFLGPSGCGKTTTLRCIAGLEEPDSGHISIDGDEVTNARPKDRNLAFVFQSIALFPHMSVRRNVRFGLDMNSDLSGDEKNNRVDEAAEMLGIQELLDRKPSELSGGQQQRVALGRAMVTDPEAFLLDEPFSALDANLRDQMQTEIKRLHNQIEKSMIFVTHDQEEAMTLGDRIIVMQDAKIQQIGTPHDIYNDPKNLFVAQFIGSPSTNVIAGQLEQHGDTATIVTDLFTLKLTAEQFAEVKDHVGGPVSLAVRPGRLTLADSDELFSANIVVIEPKGDQDLIHLTEADTDFRATTQQGKFTEVDSRVSVSMDPNDVWIFDESGNRLI